MSSTNSDEASRTASPAASIAAPATDAPAASSDSATAHEIPVYPGATRNAGQSATIHDGDDTTKVDYYDTKDDGSKVAAC